MYHAGTSGQGDSRGRSDGGRARPLTQEPTWDCLWGAHPCVRGRRIPPAVRNRLSTPSEAHRRMPAPGAAGLIATRHGRDGTLGPGTRDSRPVTIRPEALPRRARATGAPRSHRPRRSATRARGPALPGTSNTSVSARSTNRAMLRLLHTADVHLGARHADLGEQAAAQRERQFAAFRRSVDLAIAERVDLFLIAGDLFDSNTQPRRSVERVAAELRRLAQAAIRVVIIPGTHDVYDRSSIYRSLRPGGARRRAAGRRHARRAHAGSAVGRPAARWTPSSTAGSSRRSARPAARWPGSTRAPRRGPRGGSGWSTARSSIPGRTDGDEVVIDADEIAASGLDYLALGHWHSTFTARGGRRPVRLLGRAGTGGGGPGSGRQRAARDARRRRRQADRDRRGAPRRPDAVRASGRRRGRGRQPGGIRGATSGARRIADLVLDVRLTGVRPDELDLDVDEVEAGLAPSFHKVRIRDASVPALSSRAAAADRHDRRRVHPGRRGADRGAGGAEEDARARASCATCSASAGSCSPARK